MVKLESLSNNARRLYYGELGGGVVATPQYTGNIAAIKWRGYAGLDFGGQPTTEVHGYSFKYDPLSRLKKADYGRFQSDKPSTPVASDLYTVSNITYDLNGNIQTLRRNGNSVDGAIPIDLLEYTYDPSDPNKLISIRDYLPQINGGGGGNGSLPPGGGAGEGDGDTNGPPADLERGFASNGGIVQQFAYDVRGNLIQQANLGIADILYTIANLPRKITRSGSNVNITYLADGTKIKETTGGITRDYISGIEYTSEQLSSIMHAQGRVVISNSSPTYEYVLKDHLGNTRIVFRDEDNDGVVEPQRALTYYPFGMENEDLGWGNDGVGSYRYRYNGKELNEELGLYDYGARNYDPAIGRWLQVDPLADQFAAWSPYHYVYNNPLIHTDPTGMAADWIPDLDDQGNITYTSEDGDSYETFVEQYGEEAAQRTFDQNCDGCFDKSETFGEGDIILSSDEPLALQIETQGFTIVGDILRQSDGVDQVGDMTDAYNQLKFMAKLNKASGAQSFNFRDFFSGVSGTMSGPVTGSSGKSTTLTFDMSGDLSNLSVSPSFKQIGSQPNMFNIASYSTVGSSGYVPSLQISLKNYSLTRVLSPR